MTAKDVIKLLGLVPLPEEGGYYRETHRAAESVHHESLPERFTSPRTHGTAIYYLITPDSFSAMHRVASDEIFHFYMGDPVEMLQLDHGGGKTVIMGTDLETGQSPQVVVPHGIWQGTRLVPGGSFALLGCTVSPGFEFEDYEHGARKELIEQFPEFEKQIIYLTPEQS